MYKYSCMYLFKKKKKKKKKLQEERQREKWQVFRWGQLMDRWRVNKQMKSREVKSSETSE